MKEVYKKLFAWYEKEGRHDLPWRKTDDLYRVYLSEVMLQQTQVERVKEEYYPKFLKRFATLASLADAKEEEVLALWSGLGYYSRARNLHKTALLTQGKLPSSPKELLELPGIGKYTAHAICCFGAKQAVPVVDTNIARVIKRFFALQDASPKTVWEKAEAFLYHDNPRDFNLALMDLGAIVCVPKNPKCDICPLSEACAGKDAPHLYTQTKKTRYENLELFYGVLQRKGKIALVRSKGPMYKNMLQLPDCDPIEERYIGSFKHSYTKYRLKVNLYEIDSTPYKIEWIALKDLPSAAVSSLTKKAFKVLGNRLKR